MERLSLGNSRDARILMDEDSAEVTLHSSRKIISSVLLFIY